MNESNASKLSEVILRPITINDFKEMIREVVRHEILELLKLSDVPEVERPLRLKEAADYLGLCKTTLYGHVHKGKLKPLKPGKHLFFTKETLDKYMNGPEPKVDPSEYLR